LRAARGGGILTKQKNLSAIKLPSGWEATVERFLRESIRDNPEKLTEALRILNEKPAPEGRGEDVSDLFTKAALREFILAGASGSDENLLEFAGMIGVCASVKVIAAKKYPRKYFRDLAAAIRLVLKEDVSLFKSDLVEVEYWLYTYEEFAAKKSKPGRKPPASDVLVKRLSHKLKKRFGRPCDEVVAALLRAMYPKGEYDASYVGERRRRLKK
jgi:hypothetical protein